MTIWMIERKFEWFKGKFRDISVSIRQVFWSKESTLLHYKREGMIEEAKQQIESHQKKKQQKQQQKIEKQVSKKQKKK